MSITYTLRRRDSRSFTGAGSGVTFTVAVGPRGPSIISDATALGTLTDAAADAPFLLAGNAAGTFARKVTLGSVARSFLAAASQAAGRSAIDAEQAGTATAAVAAHVAAGDPHPQYALESALGTVSTLSYPGGTTLYLRADGTWATVGGGGTWGSITGTLSAQTDLQSALDAKAATAAANTFTVGGQVIQAAASVVGLSVDAANSPTTDAIRVRVGGTNYAALRQFPTPTGSGYASPVRLWMSSGTYSLSVGPDEGFLAFTLRNAADNGWANVVAGLVVAQHGLSATNNVLVGNVEISAPAWRGDRVGLGSGTAIVWCSGTAGTGTADTGLDRNAAGVVEVTNGTAGTYRDLKLRNLTASAGIITLGTFTVATLPSASANAGALAQVTDSNSTTNGGTVAGGGANRVPVFSDGTNWIVK